MSGYGTFNMAAGALQLVVPSYGLRLVRRFGPQQVGWFLVTAFVSLATLHLLEPLRPSGSAFASDVTLDIVYAIGSVLLLVGMGHIDIFFSEREQASSSQESLRAQWESRVKKETASLTRANEQLAQEVARLKEAARLLQESESQYRFLFTENPQPMWVMDVRACRFLSVNKAALRQYGFNHDDFMKLSPQDLLPAASVPAFLDHLARPANGSESRTVWQHYTRGQKLIEVELTSRDFDYAGCSARLVVISDVTQQRRRERDAYEARKMDLIGQVAGGVAHHFNNLLAAVENQAAVLRQKTQDPATIEQIEQISVAASRGTSLTSQLLAASGRQVMEAKPVDLNRLVSNLNLILRRIVGDKIVFQNSCGSSAMPIFADPQVIENILINLVKNARDAMPNGGTLTLNTAIVRVDVPPAADSARDASEFVRLTIRDTGAGFSAEAQEHLFEPFFSTKESGKGTGLSLAGIYGAVRQHSGWMEIASQPGNGSEVRVFFPCAAQAALSPRQESVAASLTKGTVLLVEPDDRARGVARYILNRHGFYVVEADCASIAMVLWEGLARKIELLVTDLRLPGGMSGAELATKLRQTRPDLKIIYACDGTSDKTSQSLQLSEGMKLVSKPYRPEQLLQSVEEFLGAEA